MSDNKKIATNGALTYMEYGVNEKGEIDKAVKEPEIPVFDNPNAHALEILGENPITISLEQERGPVER